MVCKRDNLENKGESFFALRTYRRACKKAPHTFFVGAFFIFGVFFSIHPAAAFTITPLRHTVVLDPGETKELPLFVVNDEQQPLTVSGEVDAFTIDSETGQAVFGATDEAKNWVKPVSDERTVEPGQHDELEFAITVPKDATPGAHYLGIFAKQSPGPGTVGVGTRAGALLFLHVSGSVREELVRDDFSVDSRWLFFRSPNIFLQLHNEGTIHVIPQGEIQVVNARDKVVATLPLNSESEAIYPGSKWRQIYHLEKISWTNIGPLTIRLQAQYGITKQVISDEVKVWFVPMVVVGPVVVVAVLLSFFVVRRTRKV